MTISQVNIINESKESYHKSIMIIKIEKILHEKYVFFFTIFTPFIFSIFAHDLNYL